MLPRKCFSLHACECCSFELNLIFAAAYSLLTLCTTNLLFVGLLVLFDTAKKDWVISPSFQTCPGPLGCMGGTLSFLAPGELCQGMAIVQVRELKNVLIFFFALAFVTNRGLWPLPADLPSPPPLSPKIFSTISGLSTFILSDVCKEEPLPSLEPLAAAKLSSRSPCPSTPTATLSSTWVVEREETRCLRC